MKQNKGNGQLMAKIQVITSDGKIWRPEQTYLEIAHASQQGPLELDLMAEGPCCQTSGIDSMLDIIVDQFGTDPGAYTILTSNQLSSSKYREYKIGWAELTLARQRAVESVPVKSTLNKRFAIFIGRSNWQRLGIASHLWTHHKNQTTLTFHYDPAVEYHVNNFGLEELVTRHQDMWPDVYKFVQQLPIRDQVMEYPILWDKHAFELTEQYRNIFCEIVCETYFSGRTFFVTEKTFRCIINRRPFIIQGPKWFLRNLRTLGFQTFNQWWDEGYDEDPSDARLKTIITNINYIAAQSSATVQKWYKEMQPVLDHNIAVLKSLSAKQVLSTKFYYE